MEPSGGAGDGKVVRPSSSETVDVIRPRLALAAPTQPLRKRPIRAGGVAQASEFKSLLLFQGFPDGRTPYSTHRDRYGVPGMVGAQKVSILEKVSILTGCVLAIPRVHDSTFHVDQPCLR